MDAVRGLGLTSRSPSAFTTTRCPALAKSPRNRPDLGTASCHPTAWVSFFGQGFFYYFIFFLSFVLFLFLFFILIFIVSRLGQGALIVLH